MGWQLRWPVRPRPDPARAVPARTPPTTRARAAPRCRPPALATHRAPVRYLMRVRREVRSSNRTAYPTSPPRSTPRSCATRRATVTAACSSSGGGSTCQGGGGEGLRSREARCHRSRAAAAVCTPAPLLSAPRPCAAVPPRTLCPPTTPASPSRSHHPPRLRDADHTIASQARLLQNLSNLSGLAAPSLADDDGDGVVAHRARDGLGVLADGEGLWVHAPGHAGAPQARWSGEARAGVGAIRGQRSALWASAMASGGGGVRGGECAACSGA